VVSLNIVNIGLTLITIYTGLRWIFIL